MLILLCFGRDFCFVLFRLYSRGLFLPRRAFVLFYYSRGFSFLFYGLVSHHLSLIRISVFLHGHIVFSFSTYYRQADFS